MRIRRAAAPVLAGALLLGTAACGEETPVVEEGVTEDAGAVTDDVGADPEDIDEGLEEGVADEP